MRVCWTVWGSTAACICDYQGQALSGAVCVQYGGRTCYVYGASTAVHREVMPNYLMQWEMIRWALQSGCEIYDFVGALLV